MTIKVSPATVSREAGRHRRDEDATAEARDLRTTRGRSSEVIATCLTAPQEPGETEQITPKVAAPDEAGTREAGHTSGFLSRAFPGLLGIKSQIHRRAHPDVSRNFRVPLHSVHSRNELRGFRGPATSASTPREPRDKAAAKYRLARPDSNGQTAAGGVL